MDLFRGDNLWREGDADNDDDRVRLAGDNEYDKEDDRPGEDVVFAVVFIVFSCLQPQAKAKEIKDVCLQKNESFFWYCSREAPPLMTILATKSLSLSVMTQQPGLIISGDNES